MVTISAFTAHAPRLPRAALIISEVRKLRLQLAEAQYDLRLSGQTLPALDAAQEHITAAIDLLEGGA